MHATVNTARQRGPSIPLALADLIEAFRQAMTDAGIVTEAHLLADGVLHRVHIEGQRRGSLNGAYVLHADGKPSGWFKDFVSGAECTWRADGHAVRLSEADRQHIQAARAQRQAEREVKQREQAAKARGVWDSAQPCDGSHAYLQRKHVGAYGVRLAAGPWVKWQQDETGQWHKRRIPGALLVPLRDEHGVLWNVQAIFPRKVPELGDRDKDFMPGRKVGLFHAIGDLTPTLLICEGYATGATLFEQTGQRVVVAFDAGNLLPVAQTLRRLYPSADLVLAADNDRSTPGNPGVTQATAAARAVNARLAIPDFPPDRHGSDWNDWHALHDETPHAFGTAEGER